MTRKTIGFLFGALALGNALTACEVTPSAFAPSSSPIRVSGVTHSAGAPDDAPPISSPGAAPSGFVRVAETPVSTFSADVDRTSYAVVRRLLNEGHRVAPDIVRVEEMVNRFQYAYPRPNSPAVPFQPTVAVYPSPWTEGARILHIGIRAYDVARTSRPPLNLVFLVDVSGSMAPADRLPLLKETLLMVVDDLRPDDRVAIVTYAGQSSVVLEPTAGTEKDTIRAAIGGLKAEGSTNGGAGLQTAYTLAERNFDKAAVNRVVIGTDGDFNVGVTRLQDLDALISEKRKTGVYLSVFGFGLDRLNDTVMQTLAQKGNGNAAYIDSPREARKVLRDAFSSTMVPVADNVKFQVEFNPAKVGQYRLIGYETRALARADFNNDKVDAGDVGAGHTVTALYELLPPNAKGKGVDPLRYGAEPVRAASRARSEDVGFLRIRYALPGKTRSRLIERPIRKADVLASLDAAPAEARFALAVASLGEKLRGGGADAMPYARIADLARGALGADPTGERAEFVNLIGLAERMDSPPPSPAAPRQ